MRERAAPVMPEAGKQIALVSGRAFFCTAGVGSVSLSGPTEGCAEHSVAMVGLDETHREEVNWVAVFFPMASNGTEEERNTSGKPDRADPKDRLPGRWTQRRKGIHER